MPLNAGDLDREVVIQYMEPSAGTSGFPVETWPTLATVWMSRMEKAGRERFTADQLTASGDTVWQMHYQADMDPELVDVPKFRRLQFGGRTYDIVAAAVIGRHDAIELMTLARVG